MKNEESEAKAEKLLAEITQPTSYNCINCNKQFTNEVVLRVHAETAHNQIIVSLSRFCPEKLDTKLVKKLDTKLVEKFDTKEPEPAQEDEQTKPYQCNQCPSRFKQSIS